VAFGDRVPVGARPLDRVVEAAHDESIEAAMTYLESAAARGRRGRDGLVQVETSGLVAAAFRQRTSRADDPTSTRAS
jgi:TrwC relaxase